MKPQENQKQQAQLAETLVFWQRLKTRALMLLPTRQHQRHSKGRTADSASILYKQQLVHQLPISLNSHYRHHLLHMP